VDPDFQLGFYMELMKLGFGMPGTASPQAPAPAITANQTAGQNAMGMPKAPMNAGKLMGTGPGGQQFADMAQGPSSMPGA
jgi:hypothetical protein